jgi:hypothetical protein
LNRSSALNLSVAPIRRRLPLKSLMLAAVLAAAAIAPTSASAAPTVGIGDNSPLVFQDTNFKALHTTISRKVIPYDFYNDPFQLSQLDAWVAGANADGVEPLISFSHSDVNLKKLPSVAEFKVSLNFLLAHYPTVRTISPWNEANHVSQPTFKNPKRAAQFYNATRAVCPACKIVAADVLDQKNMLPWVKTFQKTAIKPRLWGLHSYGDSNHNKPFAKSATKLLLGSVEGKVWLTEVGGLVAFKNNFPYNEGRAARATNMTLKLASKDPRIERIYFYCWYGADQRNPTGPLDWDSGFASSVGKPRPALTVLQNWLGVQATRPTKTPKRPKKHKK